MRPSIRATPAGRLINLRGEVIGINTRGSAGANNLGFAIPINVAKQVITDVLDHKKVKRSYVGVQLQPLQDLEEHYDLEKGVLIRFVEPDSPAAQAGVQPEDLLVAVNDQPGFPCVSGATGGGSQLIANQPVGAPIKLTVLRGARARSATSP